MTIQRLNRPRNKSFLAEIFEKSMHKMVYATMFQHRCMYTRFWQKKLHRNKCVRYYKQRKVRILRFARKIKNKAISKRSDLRSEILQDQIILSQQANQELSPVWHWTTQTWNNKIVIPSGVANSVTGISTLRLWVGTPTK